MRSMFGLVFAGILGLGCGQVEPRGEPPFAGAAAEGAPSARPVRYAVPIDGLRAIGREDAPVTVVTFTDYECPFCARAEATVAALKAELGDDLRVVIAEHPLPMHSNSREAALAALSVPPDRFAEMHAALFAPNAPHTGEALVHLASGVGVDESAFRARFAGKEAHAALTEAEDLAASLHVNGTPTFFVNGIRIDGAQPLDRFVTVAREELAYARGLLAKGIAPNRVYAALLAEARENPPAMPAPSPAPAPELTFVPAAKETGGAAYLGALDAPRSLVVFVDYECPFSKRLDAQLRTFSAEHSDVRVVVRNRPLSFHVNARLAAQAAIAAELQGKLEPYAQALYAHGDAHGRAELVAYADQLGLDRARFLADLDSTAVAKRLADDEAWAEKLGVTGTPTSFVDGQRIVGAQPPATFALALSRPSE